ncbi:protein PSK SIMULATOR 1-like [Curcuma longa]|uniref:protein PSK SIMULATOR 1-like n=1 Tax=Curcuma longa TaxID=136217 RepID=UPI003D9F33E3
MGVTKVLADLRARCPLRPAVGILAFEAAAAMARLVSLHRSLAEEEVRLLRARMRAPGVAYLTSKDQIFLLRVAVSELVGDLDAAAAAVSRLAPRCSDPLLRAFDRLYADLKVGGVYSFLIDARAAADLDRLGLGSTAKRAERRVRRMERYVAATSSLYAEMEVLNELEAAEKRAQQQEQQKWRRHSGPIPVQKPPSAPDPVRFQLRTQMHRIRRLKEESLWNKTFDKAVELMVRAVVTVFSRICAVFGVYVLGLPGGDQNNSGQFKPSFFGKHSSGPLERRVVPQHVAFLRNSAPIMRTMTEIGAQETPFDRLRKFLKVSPTTVGGSGLALRYVNVILAAEKLFQEGNRVAAEAEEEPVAAAREELYEMLPSGMRAAVRAKLREFWRKEGSRLSLADESLADGWREAVAAILAWLVPVALDTKRWQEERNMDREQRFCTRPRTLLLQTLHYADVDKAEAAVVEVLVGLSCITWYDDRRQCPSELEL